MTPESILRIGKVIAVKGRLIEVLVDKTKNGPHIIYEGTIIRNVSVGSYIKIGKGFQQLVGKIEEEFITEDKEYIGKNYRREQEIINRILKICLVGYIEKNSFKQGIKELPLIDNECFLLNNTEFDRVHDFLKKGDAPLIIGNLANETNKSIGIGINSLFASHIGIFGNTGSGKSYTLASLYHSLFRKFQDHNSFQKNAKFLLMDFNGEYSSSHAITDKKNVFNLSTRKKLELIDKNDKIPLSENVIINVELLSILASATEKTQKPFIKRTVEYFDKVMASDSPLDRFKNFLKLRIIDVLSMANREIAYSLLDYLFILLLPFDSMVKEKFFTRIDWNNSRHHFMPKGDPRNLTIDEMKKTPLYGAVDDYEFPVNCVDKFIHFLYLQLIFDLHTHKVMYEHISPAIHKLKSKTNDLYKVFDFHPLSRGIFSDDKNFTVINLNDVNLDIKKTLPLILSKNIYEEHKSLRSHSKELYLNIIIDEAHNILSYSSERESETWKDYRLETFEEIIKEGRKFGVFLTISSQRPSDISTTIISQLHNYFLHRLINNKDIEAVERTISYLDKVSFDSLPILPTGACILAGLSAQLPVIININELDNDFQPDSHTIKPIDYWLDSKEIAPITCSGKSTITET